MFGIAILVGLLITILTACALQTAPPGVNELAGSLNIREPVKDGGAFLRPFLRHKYKFA